MPLKFVLARPNFRENLSRRPTSHANSGRHIGQIGAQKRVGFLFLADGDRNGRLLSCDFLLRPPLTCGKRLVVRLDRAREFDVRLGVFMTAINFGVVWKIAQFYERMPHLVRRSFDDATTADRKQRVADECELVCVKPVSDVTERVARRFNHIG